MQIDQVGTLVPGSSLKQSKRTSPRTCLDMFNSCPFRVLTSIASFRLFRDQGFLLWCPPYHYANVVPVVTGQGSVHLKQVMLCLLEAVQVLRMEAHHQADVIQPAEQKGLLEYRLRSGVHFADLKDLGTGRGKKGK